MTLPALLLVTLATCQGTPYGLPPAEADSMLARVAPPECIAYLSWEGSREADPSSSNPTEQLIADPQVDRLLSLIPSVANLMAEEIARGTGIDHPVIEHAPLIAELIVSRPTAFYLTELEISPFLDIIQVEGGLFVQLGDDISSLTQTLQQLAPLLSAFPDAEQVTINGSTFYQLELTEGMTVTWGLQESYLLIGIGEGQIATMLANLETPPPAWYSQVQQSLAVDEQSQMLYANAQAILQMVEPLLRIPDARAVFDALGLGNVEYYASLKGLDGEEVATRTELMLSGAPRGLLAVLAEDPLGVDDLAPIPADASVACSLQLDLELLVDSILNIMGEVDPRTVDAFHHEVEQIEGHLGIDLFDGVIGALGTTWCLYLSPSENSSIITGWTGTVRLRDPERAELTSERLKAQLERNAAEVDPESDEFYYYWNPPSLGKIEFRDHTIYTFFTGDRHMPIVPCWCIVEDQLVFSCFVGNLKSYLRRDSQFESLADDERIDEFFRLYDGPTGLSLIDEKALMTELYPWLLCLLQTAMTNLDYDPHMLAPQLGEFGITSLPSIDAITPHVERRAQYYYPTGQGFRSELRETNPLFMREYLQPFYLGAFTLQMRNLDFRYEERSSARRMEEISHALESYRRANGAYPPAYSTDEQGNPLHSWRVLLLPYLQHDSFIADNIRYDEPWDSEHNREFLQHMPYVYRFENDTSGFRLGGYQFYSTTGFQTIRLPQSPFPAERSAEEEEFSDGRFETILVVETNQENAVPWMAPEDYQPDPSDPLSGLKIYPGGFYAATGGQQAWLFPPTLAPETFFGFTTPSGGEGLSLEEHQGRSDIVREFRCHRTPLSDEPEHFHEEEGWEAED